MRTLIRLLFVACLLALAPQQALAAVFKIATIAPDGTSWMQEMRAGAEEIKRRTDGRVQFKFYPGGIMGNDKSVMRKIRIGQLQGGAMTGGGLAEIYPDSQIYSLPFAFRSYDEVDHVRAQLDPVIIDGLRERGFISFGISEGGFAYLMSNRPLYCIDDLKGQKIWAPEGDALSRSAFEAIGVSPIPLPLTDVLTGLQTGLIDTVGSSPIGAIALQWHTRVKYLTDTPLMYLTGSLIVQRKALDKLPAGDRAIVTEVMQGVFARLNRKNREDNELALEALREQGIALVSPPAEKAGRWHAQVQGAIDHLEREGVYSTRMLDQFQKILNEYRQRHGTP